MEPQAPGNVKNAGRTPAARRATPPACEKESEDDEESRHESSQGLPGSLWNLRRRGMSRTPGGLLQLVERRHPLAKRRARMMRSRAMSPPKACPEVYGTSGAGECQERRADSCSS